VQLRDRVGETSCTARKPGTGTWGGDPYNDPLAPKKFCSESKRRARHCCKYISFWNREVVTRAGDCSCTKPGHRILCIIRPSPCTSTEQSGWNNRAGRPAFIGPLRGQIRKIERVSRAGQDENKNVTVVTVLSRFDGTRRSMQYRIKHIRLNRRFGASRTRNSRVCLMRLPGTKTGCRCRA